MAGTGCATFDTVFDIGSLHAGPSHPGQHFNNINQGRACLQGIREEEGRMLIAMELASGSLQSWCAQFEGRRQPLSQWVRLLPPATALICRQLPGAFERPLLACALQ